MKVVLWLKLTPTYFYAKDNDIRRKSTPLSFRKELKKTTVRIVCNPKRMLQKILCVNKITNFSITNSHSHGEKEKKPQ